MPGYKNVSESVPRGVCWPCAQVKDHLMNIIIIRNESKNWRRIWLWQSTNYWPWLGKFVP